MSQDSADELNGRFTMANVLIADIKTELQLHTLIFKVSPLVLEILKPYLHP